MAFLIAVVAPRFVPSGHVDFDTIEGGCVRVMRITVDVGRPYP